MFDLLRRRAGGGGGRVVLEPGSGSRSRLRLNIPVIGCGVRRGLGGAEEGGGRYMYLSYTLVDHGQ